MTAVNHKRIPHTPKQSTREESDRLNSAICSRVVFLGTRGSFSVAPLKQLIETGFEVRAVVVPGNPGGLPVRTLEPPAGSPTSLPMLSFENETNIVHLAWERRIPVLAVTSVADPAVVEAISAQGPDVACVACFPWRLPGRVLAIPRYGCLNLHPSLLPANRGPAPLFWTFRNGESRTGVTVHLMDTHIDTGDIIEQQELDIPDGITGNQLDRACSVLGARLLAKATRALLDGSARPTEQLEEAASYHSWPSEADFVVPTSKPARWAFNFIRGVSNWETPVTIEAGDVWLQVRSALSYSKRGTLADSVVRNEREAWVQFDPGVLHVALP